MNVPQKIKVIENCLGEREFIFTVEHSFVAGLIVLMFSFCCLTVIATIGMELAVNWVPIWKNMALVGLLLIFLIVHLFIFYLGLFCWGGKSSIKIQNGILSYYAGVFGVGRRITCAISDIQKISIQSKERKDKWQNFVRYDLRLQLRNAKTKKIPFGDDLATVKFFEKYLIESLS